MEPGVFRSDTGVIQACRDGVCIVNLSVLILEQISPVPVEHAGAFIDAVKTYREEG